MRKTALLAGGFALALALTGCGGGQNDGQTGGGENGGTFNDTQSLIRAAQQGTQDIQTAKFTMNMAMGPIVMDGTGAGRFSKSDYAMSMISSVDMSGLFSAMAGASGESMPEGANPGKMEFEMRMVGKELYLKMPSGMPGADSSKPWVKGSLDDLTGGAINMEQMLDQADPTKTLENLVKDGKIVKTEPGEEVDGQATTKYTINVNLEKAIKRMAPDLGAMSPGGMSGDVPVQVWIDDRNLPMQLTMDFSEQLKKAIDEQAKNSGEQIPPGMAEMFEKATMTMKYTDWGSEVNVEAPPADQVGEMPAGMAPGN